MRHHTSALLVVVTILATACGGGGGDGPVGLVAPNPATLAEVRVLCGSGRPDGGFYLAGSGTENSVFGEGEPNETILPTNGAVLARYRADHTLAWVANATAGRIDSVATLPGGSAIALGWIASGPAVFGAGEPNETEIDSGLFMARYGPDGALDWARQVAIGSGTYGITSVDSFPDGSFVLGGTMRAGGAVVVAPGEAEETTIPASASDYGVVMRYAADGTLTWIRRIQSARCFAWSVAAAPDGSTIIVGDFSEATTFEPDQTQLAAPVATDAFVAKYAADGSLDWARRAGGHALQAMFAAVLDDGSVLVTGGGFGAATFGAGEPNETTIGSANTFNGYVARYATNGSLDWATKYGTASANRISAFPDGACVISGTLRGSDVVFGAGQANETTLTSAGDADLFVARFDPGGAFEWAVRAGGSDLDVAAALVTFPDDTAVTGGSIGSADADFGPAPIDEAAYFARVDRDGELR